MFEKAGIELLGNENVKFMQLPEMGYDDFAYFGTISRAAYLYLGTSNENDLGKFTFHQPNFDVDESCLSIGVELLINIINKISEKEE